MDYKEKILADELAENNDAIDAFQLYADTISIGRSEFNVLNSDGFYDALAYFLATMPTGKEIAKGVIKEYIEKNGGHDTYHDKVKSFLIHLFYWLDKDDKQ